MPSFKFPKNKRLCNSTLIKHLLNKGNVINHYPIKLIWSIDEKMNSSSDLQLLIIVSKRRFKNAVQRNYIKRIIRECFRKVVNENLSISLNPQQQISLAIIYTGNDQAEYFLLFKKIKEILCRLNKDVAFILE